MKTNLMHLNILFYKVAFTDVCWEIKKSVGSLVKKFTYLKFYHFYCLTLYPELHNTLGAAMVA